MSRRSAFFQQMRFEEVEEQIALPAAADARHDLDETVALCLDKPPEVEISLDFHGGHYTRTLPANQDRHSILRWISTRKWKQALVCAIGEGPSVWGDLCLCLKREGRA